MRLARVTPDKTQGPWRFHCLSRTMDWIFDVRDRNCPVCLKFVEIMRDLEEFTGVRVLTYTLMSNHFHILAEQPQDTGEVIAEQEVLRRFGVLHGEGALRNLERDLHHLREVLKTPQAAEAQIDKLRARMGDVSIFMKELKGRFAQWYNITRKRYGVLWKERFKSVVVEDGQALITMATYIDLNCVRAGIVTDPKDYKWCGYAEAIGAEKTLRTKAREGLRRVVEGEGTERGEQGWTQARWDRVQSRYRKCLFDLGRRQEGPLEPGEKIRGGIPKEEVEKVLKAGGKLSPAQALRCRIRYFNDGVALGSKEFIESIFRNHRQNFSAKRKDGARKLRGLPWDNLHTMRDLRKEPVSVP